MRQLLRVGVLLLSVAFPCCAQGQCSTSVLLEAAAPVLTLQTELEHIKVGETEDSVPPAVADKLVQLRNALSNVSAVALACSTPSVDPTVLQKQLADVLRANAPEPAPNTVISNSDHRYDEVFGSYGHNLRVQVSRPADISDVLAVQYSINIECGSADSMLLVYELKNGRWAPSLRWQSPPLKTVSDAFGDFFLTSFLHVSASSKKGETEWRVVVAHGTPWCTSRFSGFKMDVLSPGSDSELPKVLWHINRGYSRGDFSPRLKSSGKTFELRLNADCMVFDTANCFERRVIYRYEVDSSGHVRRLNPLALNARGFVEEWLFAPWSESRDFSAEPTAVLQKVHDHFEPPMKPGGDQFVNHSLGPVRACAAAGVFQVQINSRLERIITGKPGGESKPLPSNYFHVRQVKDGYLMLSAPTEPDSTCNGPNLMSAHNK